MLRPRISIFGLLAVITGLSIVIATIVNRVNEQQHAVVTLREFGGSAFYHKQRLGDSFVTNLRNSVTKIEIPRILMIKNMSYSINRMPNLKKIVVTSEYEPEEMANIRKRFPQLEITHAFEPLIDLIH